MLDIEKKYLSLAGISVKREYRKQIVFRCPVCGDSKQQHKARGYLSQTETGSVYFCHNCNFTGTFSQLLDQIDVTLKSAYLSEVRREYRQMFGHKKEEDVFSKPKPNMKLDVITFGDDSFVVTELTPEAITYLKFRGVDESDFNHFKYVPGKKCVITFLALPDVVFGYQLRSIEGKFFHIHVEEGYDKCWNLDHVLKLPKGTTVYVFESIFNAHSVTSKNVLAGLGSSMSSDLLEMLKDYKLIFCYDNDKTGVEKAIKFTSMGYDALVHHENFVWGDFNDALQSGKVTRLMLQGYIEANVMSAKSANFKLRKKLINF